MSARSAAHVAETTAQTPTAPTPAGVEAPEPGALRIGEAAKACGLTTRTLRYWEEIGLLAPSEKREGGERLYGAAEVERARRIKEIQELLGFSLSQIRAVLDTEDVLDGWRSAHRSNAQPELQFRLLSEAIEANDKLVAQLDEVLDRIRAFRDERAHKAERLRARSSELESETQADAR